MDAIPITFHLSADEAAYVEACLARRRELLAVCDEAPYGQVLARCEEAVSEIVRQQGRELYCAPRTGRKKCLGEWGVASTNNTLGKPKTATSTVVRVSVLG